MADAVEIWVAHLHASGAIYFVMIHGRPILVCQHKNKAASILSYQPYLAEEVLGCHGRARHRDLYR